MWLVLVPKYSHGQSAFTRIHSSHRTEKQAREAGTLLDMSGRYRFVEVEHAPDLPKRRAAKGAEPHGITVTEADLALWKRFQQALREHNAAAGLYDATLAAVEALTEPRVVREQLYDALNQPARQWLVYGFFDDQIPATVNQKEQQ
jgi:hypothetical protein